jgi:putative flippase GtrA
MTERSVLISRVLRYGVAGLVATAIYFLSVMLLVERAHLAPVAAAIVATIVVIVSSYIINRTFVFDTNRTHTSAFPRFVTASLLGIGLNAALMHVATVVLAWPYLAGAALSTVVVPPLNFFVNYLWAFRREL